MKRAVNPKNELLLEQKVWPDKQVYNIFCSKKNTKYIHRSIDDNTRKKTTCTLAATFFS